MGRKALVVGINDYKFNPLKCCINDANKIKGLLSRNYDGSVNFDVFLETDLDSKSLRGCLRRLFESDPEIALFYFSGHGCSLGNSGYLVTTDCEEDAPGLDVDEVIKMAVNSKAKNKIIIVDACFSGMIGQSPFNTYVSNLTEGMTIMTSSKSDEPSMEVGDHGLFTSLLIDALSGGASDILGNITAGGVYSYIDRCLGPWEQRPVFKTNISSFVPIVKTGPLIEPDQLRKIVQLFKDPEKEFDLDPSYEDTNSPVVKHELKEPYAVDDHVKVFKILQKYSNEGLVKPVGAEYMYFAAMNSKSCALTTKGKYYHKLIKEGRI